MYRGDLTEAELLDHIQEFKTAVPTVEVGYVDAYYEFTDRPKITEALRLIAAADAPRSLS